MGDSWWQYPPHFHMKYVTQLNPTIGHQMSVSGSADGLEERPSNSFNGPDTTGPYAGLFAGASVIVFTAS